MLSGEEISQLAIDGSCQSSRTRQGLPTTQNVTWRGPALGKSSLRASLLRTTAGTRLTKVYSGLRDENRRPHVGKTHADSRWKRWSPPASEGRK